MIARHFTFGRMSLGEEEGNSAWLKAKFCCGTQLPCIELEVNVGTQQASRKACILIFGTHLTRTEGVLPIAMETGKSSQLRQYFRDHVSNSEVKSKQPSPDRPDLAQAVEKHRVTCIDIKLLGGPGDTLDIEGRPARPLFRGQVTARELKQWAEDACMDTVHMSDAERFLGLMYAGRLRDFKIYYMYHIKPNGKFDGRETSEHKHFCEYFQSVMLFAKRLGHFWAFRKQTPEADWKSTLFPYDEMELPRWTVTRWEDAPTDDRAQQGEELEVSLPAPAEWVFVDTPRVFPGIEEAMFLCRLGLSHERKAQHGYFERAINAHTDEVDVVITRNLLMENAFKVKIFCDFDEGKRQPVLPPPDIGLTVVLMNNVKLIGKVTSTNQKFGSELDFRASVMAPVGSNIHVDGRKRKATLTFWDDNPFLQRQYTATLGIVPDELDGKGIYVPHLLFGADIPDEWDADYHLNSMKPKTMAVFDNELARFTLLSEEQIAFGSECLAPSKGIAIGQCRPGAVKTTTIVAIAQAAMKVGYKVLICTQTDEAKIQLINGWSKNSDPDIHNGFWFDWTSAHAKSGSKRNADYRAPSYQEGEIADKELNNTVDEPAAASHPRKSLPFESLSDGEAQAVATQEAAKLAKEVADAEEARLNELTRAHCIDQAVTAASLGMSNVDKNTFSYRRLQFGTQLAKQSSSESAIAQRWMHVLCKGRNDLHRKQSKEQFVQDDILLNENLMQRTKLIFANCNMSAHETLATNFHPDLIVIDEADATLTTELAVPVVTFQDSVKSIVLIGDSKCSVPTFVSDNKNSASREMRRTIFGRYTRGAAQSTANIDHQPQVFRLD